MTIRKNRPPPNVVVPRRPATTAKSGKGSSSNTKSNSVGGASGSSKGSSQVKLGSNAFSVDHVDHADPDQKRGRQQFQNTGSQPAAESLSSSAKKAVGSDGKLRRSNKSAPKKKTTVVDDDDGPDGIAHRAHRAHASKGHKTTSHVSGPKETAKESKGDKKVEAGKGGEGKAAKGTGRGKVSRKSSGERLEQNEAVSVLVESSGSGAGTSGAGGGKSTEGAATGGAREGASAEGVSSEGVSSEGKAGGLTGPEANGEGGLKEVAVAGGAAAVSAAVLEGGRETPELQRVGAGNEIKDAAFQAAVKDTPKAEVIEVAQHTEQTDLRPALETVSSGQLESDIQDDLHAGAVETKRPGAPVDDDSPFDDVASSIAEDGAPIDGVLGDDASRAKAAAKGVPFVKDGTRRGIDAPVEKAVNEMAVATGKAGVDATDIANDTKKLGAAEDGDGDGEAEEEDDDGEAED